MIKPTGYIEIFNSYRNQIRNGSIAAGDRLPSIRELAKSSGVSALTAQRAFAKLQQEGYVKANGRHGCVAVDDWRRGDVAMAKAGDGSAGTMRGLNVGLIVYWDKEDTIVQPLLRLVERALVTRIYGAGGTVHRLVVRKGREEESVSAALKSECRIFFSLLEYRHKLLARLQENAAHCVDFVGSVSDWSSRFDTVCVDDAWAFREFGRRLARMGHERIAFVGITPSDPLYKWCGSRSEALKEGICEAGGDAGFGKAFFLKGYDDFGGIGKIFRELCRHTAVACANDYIAETIVRALRGKGIRVPEDVSVTGYDNSHNDFVQNELTTAVVPEEKIVSSFLNLAQTRLAGDAGIGETTLMLVRPIIIPRSSWRSV